MTPKDKAVELVEEYTRNVEDISVYEARICALIAIDNLLKFMDKFDLDLELPHQLQWWRQVKEEIENL
jgi:hypothetical protein